VITRVYMGPASGRSRGADADADGEEKRWWQVWR
jgi:hypothetical protein